MTDAAAGMLSDIFAACVQASRCGVCRRPLVDEADWIDERVYCPDCATVHGPPGAARVHCVWTPAVAAGSRPPTSTTGPTDTRRRIQ